MATKKRRSKAIPKTLGGCADRLYELRAERQELNREVKEIEALESAIKEKLIEELPKSQAEGVTGKTARAMIKSKAIGHVTDWGKLYDHIRRKKDFSLLQRRLSDASVQDQWESGKKIPGVEPFTVLKVSLTKK